MRQYLKGNGKYVLVYKNSGEVLNKLMSRGFCVTSLSTYAFSTLYTTLPHNLIKEKLLDLIERAFERFYKTEGTLYLACNDKTAFFTSTDHIGYMLWSCQNVCDALSYLLDNIYIRFGNKLNRQIVGVPMGTNCAPLIADLISFASMYVVTKKTLIARNRCLTAKLLKQGYRYHKLRKAFAKFYRPHYELISKFIVLLKSLLHQGLSEPELNCDLVY